MDFKKSSLNTLNTRRFSKDCVDPITNPLYLNLPLYVSVKQGNFLYFFFHGYHRQISKGLTRRVIEPLTLQCGIIIFLFFFLRALSMTRMFPRPSRAQ